jgi:hypothetical protein
VHEDVQRVLQRLRAMVHSLIEAPSKPAARFSALLQLSGPAASALDVLAAGGQVASQRAAPKPRPVSIVVLGKTGSASDVHGAPPRLDVATLHPEDLARQLTLLDHAKFAAVRAVDLVHRMSSARRRPSGHARAPSAVAALADEAAAAHDDSSALGAFIAWFNHLSYYVATEVRARVY